MKKIIIWSMLLICPLLGIGMINFLLYEKDAELDNFPIPNNAELMNQNEFGNNYSWSKASEENGIPFGYEIVLWVSGWKKGEREGASVYYSKGNHTIDLISTREHLTILRVNDS
ncbi:hypothetical protein [Paucisalibacillus sp. EB02]|uniref:hypothetical protein n=1 Tax=Paucisalibacillus sp. EB02 TaxID=1347087 RepID=UPI0004B67C34|nr:hypothetical protein [Paucisalibacillus sp. EB02]